MKYLVRFFVIIIITFCSIKITNAENPTIVYIDMDKVMNESIAGKNLIEQLEKIHKSNILSFKKIEDELKKEEESIVSKKNIISNDEYIKKVNSLKTKIKHYENERQEKINLVSKKKNEATKRLLKELNPILANYSKEKSISIILKKKDLIIARSDLEITNEIIDLVNSKIKKIELN